MKKCQSAISEKYEEYRERAIGYLMSNFHRWGEEMAKDICQDAFEALWIYCQTSGEELTENFFPLVTVICRRKMIDEIRKTNTFDRFKNNLSYLLDKEVEETVEEKARRALLAQCQQEMYLRYFGLLTPECQKILDVRFQGYSWSEIAEILNIEGMDPANNVRNRADYCRGKLVKQVKENNDCDEFEN